LTPRKSISVFGGGIAGLSAAQMLTRLGHAVAITAARPPAARRIALNGASRFLLERVWGCNLASASSHHMLERRILSWDGLAPVILDDDAVVADVADLVADMKSILERNNLIEWRAESACRAPDILAADADGRDRYVTGGKRKAVQAQVLLSETADTRALSVEATASGWLVILPIGGGMATLMGVAPGENVCLSTLLEESRYSRSAVSQVGPSSSPSSATPRLVIPSQSAGAEMRVGDTAMRFDPISGDGVAGALRGAHLAALVLDRRESGLDSVAPAAIYERRLAKAMLAHLEGLVRLYITAPLAKNWAYELRAMETMKSDIVAMWPDRETRAAVMENSLTTF
jgi:flavin-dependent dehydrogenase